jgi:hypothetical protein
MHSAYLPDAFAANLAAGLANDDDTLDSGGKLHFRTIWISDIHLGTRGCNAEQLRRFLKHSECQTLYLDGDIIDGWRLKMAGIGRTRTMILSGASSKKPKATLM